MTSTAQGTALRCDKHGCNAVATVDRDAWSFCAAHAGAPIPVRAGTVRAAPAPPATSRPPADLNPQDRPGPIGQLLEQASGHSVAKVRRLGEKIETHLDDLRKLLSDLADDERRRQAELAAKAKARADVERLERELAEAKAKLRGPGKSTTKPSRAVTSGVATSGKPCVGCGGSVTRPAGTRGSWSSRCDGCKAAV